MPILIKNIKGEVVRSIDTNISYISMISGEIQREDYVYLNTFIGFTQNLSKTEETYGIVNPINFGLLDIYNKTEVTLEINY